jgi:hypothetical protein
MTPDLELPAAILLGASVIACALALLAQELGEWRRRRKCGCDHEARAHAAEEEARAQALLYTRHKKNHTCTPRNLERY